MDLSFSAIESIKSEQILENYSRKIDSNYLQIIVSILNWTIIICRSFFFHYDPYSIRLNCE